MAIPLCLSHLHFSIIIFHIPSYTPLSIFSSYPCYHYLSLYHSQFPFSLLWCSITRLSFAHLLFPLTIWGIESFISEDYQRTQSKCLSGSGSYSLWGCKTLACQLLYRLSPSWYGSHTRVAKLSHPYTHTAGCRFKNTLSEVKPGVASNRWHRTRKKLLT